MKPDGNCLYNAVSMALIGNESLAHHLRLLTCQEMLNHSSYYADHPLFKKVYDSGGGLFCSEKSVFVMSMSFKATNDYTYNSGVTKAMCIRSEAAKACSIGSFSSMVCVMALASVLNRDIYSYAPSSPNTKQGILLNCHITPRVSSARDPVQLMWTKFDQSSQSLNHFVPLFVIHLFKKKAENARTSLHGTLVSKQQRINELLKRKSMENMEHSQAKKPGNYLFKYNQIL